MKLILAPMEGLLDSYLREIITSIGGYEWCVSEFIRVVDKLLPARVFYRVVPELRNGGVTASGVPVYVQLMGNLPSVIADNGARAVELGSRGVDLNFGCPSPLVNRNGAGAILLNEPEKIYQIVLALRQAVPDAIPVMAKIRLGYEDTSRTLDVVEAIEAAGADMITVHARTRADKYKPPARWEWFARIRECIDIPVIANGDITDVASLTRYESLSGCEHFMIGRAAVHNPYLALQINQSISGDDLMQIQWKQHQRLLFKFSELMLEVENSRGAASRVKQWLRLLIKGHEANHTEAGELFDRLKNERDLLPITQILKGL